MKLIYKQYHILTAGGFLYHAFQALLKVAAILRPGEHRRHTGVVRCMKKLLDENPDTPCTLRGTDFAAKDVFDAARAGDALAAREVDEMTDTLGMALASIASTTDPEMFMVGGGVARAGDVLFNPLREHSKTYAFSSCRETPIVAATLGNDAGIYGAVRLIVGE